MRSHEHGLIKYFENISERTFKQLTAEMRSNILNSDTMVAVAGCLQEIIIACFIYLIGMSFALVIFFLEYFSKRNCRKI